MASGNSAEEIDAAISSFFSDWNFLSTAIVLIISLVILIPLLTAKDPDVHPFLLARQAQASLVRQPGESAVYRATEVPHGYPLRAGLAVKDPGAPKWTAGRNGDLRDIWRQAVNGPTKEDGSSAGPKGKIMTVLGREKVIEHNLDDLTIAINVIGKTVQGAGGTVVAVCLSNSVELLCAIFAAAFYGFSLILIPHGITQDKLNTVLEKSQSNFLIAEAGAIDLESTLASAKTIGSIVWVVKEASKHMDWDDVPEGAPRGFSVSSWHDLIEKKKSSDSSQVLPQDSKLGPLYQFYSSTGTEPELIQLNSANIISGVAGLLGTMPRGHKLGPSDLILSTISLTDSYALCWTLAALFSNASIALNSVAGPEVDIELATAGVHPTVIVAAPATVHKYYSTASKTGPGAIAKYMQKSTFSSGRMPANRPTIAISTLSKVRALLIALPDSTTNKLPSKTLFELRMLLGARVALALTSPRVAGAVTQTHFLDYRDKGVGTICVGPPVTSVEISFTGSDGDVGGTKPRGKITVKGPSVAGGQTTLETVGQLDKDFTVLLV